MPTLLQEMSTAAEENLDPLYSSGWRCLLNGLMDQRRSTLTFIVYRDYCSQMRWLTNVFLFPLQETLRCIWLWWWATKVRRTPHGVGCCWLLLFVVVNSLIYSRTGGQSRVFLLIIRIMFDQQGLQTEDSGSHWWCSSWHTVVVGDGAFGLTQVWTWTGPRLCSLCVLVPLWFGFLSCCCGSDWNHDHWSLTCSGFGEWTL